jgi:sugar lactone lactonase YvrE
MPLESRMSNHLFISPSFDAPSLSQIEAWSNPLDRWTEAASQRNRRKQMNGQSFAAGRWVRCAFALLVVLLTARAGWTQTAFGALAVGTVSGQQSVVLQTLNAGRVATVQVVTQGAGGLDFAVPSTPAFSCAGSVLVMGGSCQQSVTFTPAYPGLRIGAVVLLDANNNLLAETLLFGTGTGALGVLIPGNIVPVAGDGLYLDAVVDGVNALQTELYVPSSVALDGAGNLYIADTFHHRIRKVTAGIVSTIAGTGNPGYSGDGAAAAQATLNTPYGVALDGAGNLYIADAGNNVVRRIDAVSQIITTVAGNGAKGSATVVGDGGPAIAANLNTPRGVTLDPLGNLYIADTFNHRVRKVSALNGQISAASIINTIAGTGFQYSDGKGAYSGDGGAATAAELNYPYAVAFDPAGNIYIPDSANNRIRMVNAGTAIISTFAGSSQMGYSGDGGAATAATLDAPSGVTVDAAGNVYLADTQNRSIRKVNAVTGNISTLAANGKGEYIFNGNLYSVELYGPVGITLDGNGDLFVADSLYMRIREVQSNLSVLDYTANIVRQGSDSATQDVLVEDDGNAPLDLTAITAAVDAAIDTTVSNSCAAGNPYLAVAADCTVGAIFAPAATPALAANTTETPEIGIADLTTGSITGANSPLVIELVGTAAPVNSTTVTLKSSPNPSAFNQSVAFTATVTTGTGTLTGTVNFIDLFQGKSTTLASNVAINASSVAVFSTAQLAVGIHSISACYNNTKDASHLPSCSTDNSTPALRQEVDEATSTAISSSENPAALGDNVTFIATVASKGGGVPLDGSVTFSDGAALLATIPINAAGVATYSTSTLANGLHSILAAYSGDAANQILASSSAALNEDVLGGSAVALASAPNPSNYGAPVTFTITVTPSASAAATGTVKILDGAQLIGTTALVGATNTGSFTISTLSVGTHPISAVYAGDSNYAGGTSATVDSQVVNPAQTTTTVAALPNPGIAGAAVALTATVQATLGAGTQTGTVNFTDAGVSLGSAALNKAGTATINPVLAAGAHSIVAIYAGDGNNGGSTSSALPLNVVLATTSTELTSTPNPSLAVSSVTFTAKVAGNGGVPTGSISFVADGSAIGSSALDATGTATLSYASLAVGSHAMTAIYAGDANNAASTSSALTQVVQAIPTVTALGTASSAGQNPVTILVATVVGLSGPAPTGTVSFSSGATVIGSVPLDSSGVATLIPNLAAGAFNIVATYSGDSLHAPSTSSSVSITNTPTGFDLSVTPPSVSIATTKNATVTVTLTSNSGFTDTIGLGCASLPAAVSCHFASISTNLAANAVQTVQLTIDTNNPLSGGDTSMNMSSGSRSIALAGLFLPFSLLMGCIVWRWRRRNAAFFSPVLLLLLSSAVMLFSGCGGFSQSSATPGAYVIQVTGIGANSDISHYQNVTLTITNQ